MGRVNEREIGLALWVVLVVVGAVLSPPAGAVAIILVGILAPVVLWYRFAEMTPGVRSSEHLSFRRWLTKH